LHLQRGRLAGPAHPRKSGPLVTGSDPRNESELRLSLLRDWLEVPEFKSYAGLGIYTKNFEAPRAATAARICLGRVEQSAEVRMNGRQTE
jgi:hypothetical protein